LITNGRHPELVSGSRPVSCCSFVYSALAFFRMGISGDVFSSGEEIFVRRERADAVGVGIRPLQLRRLQGIGASHSQMSRCSRPALPYDAAVVENLLKLDDGGAALTRCEIRPAAYTHLVEAGHIGNERNLP